jgi:hypothetical protein
MASWEEELAVLLRDLGVKQEEPQAQLQQKRKPSHSDVKGCEQCADALFVDEDKEIDEEDLWVQDIATMRREVDTIVSQVIVLMQRGDLEPSVKEDVMIVLRALRRHLPSAHSSVVPATSEEAYLESASALLHFCRLALQLSEFATEDF